MLLPVGELLSFFNLTAPFQLRRVYASCLSPCRTVVSSGWHLVSTHSRVSARASFFSGRFQRTNRHLHVRDIFYRLLPSYPMSRTGRRPTAASLTAAYILLIWLSSMPSSAALAGASTGRSELDMLSVVTNSSGELPSLHIFRMRKMQESRDQEPSGTQARG